MPDCTRYCRAGDHRWTGVSSPEFERPGRICQPADRIRGDEASREGYIAPTGIPGHRDGGTNKPVCFRTVIVACARQKWPSDSAIETGARTRAGRPCRTPPVTGRTRCRMHGGAKGSGAPRGNRNAVKHGRYTAAAEAERRAVMELIRLAGETLEGL